MEYYSFSTLVSTPYRHAKNKAEVLEEGKENESLNSS